MFDGPSITGLDAAERRARLGLARSPRIGPVTFREALQHFGSAQAACASLAVAGEAAIVREEASLGRAGGRFLVVGDAGYPASLAALPDAPSVLSAIGDLSLLERRTLAIVGAHEAALPTGTVAVLAGGIDQIYPPQNAGLQRSIAARGLLLTEAPFGTPPVARAFPRRNRIDRPGGRDRGGRGGGALGLPDHRSTRRRTGARGLCRSGLAHGPASCRVE